MGNTFALLMTKRLPSLTKDLFILRTQKPIFKRQDYVQTTYRWANSEGWYPTWLLTKHTQLGMRHAVSSTLLKIIIITLAKLQWAKHIHSMLMVT